MASASRSALMARIRGQDTEPERLLRDELARHGVIHVAASAPIGRPDVADPRIRLAVFVDGCFWHGCPDHYVRPRTRAEFWASKLSENVARDIQQVADLEAAGWRVRRVWEHEVFEDLARCVGRIVEKGEPISWRVFFVQPVDADGAIERRYMCELRGCEEERVIEQRRHTRKWRRSSARRE